MGMKITSGFHLGRIAECEIFEALRKVFRPRHGRVVDQNGDDRNVLLQRRLDLDAHRIALVLDAPVSAAARTEPLRTDHDNDHVAAQKGVLDVLAKIRPERDIVDIHEQ